MTAPDTAPTTSADRSKRLSVIEIALMDLERMDPEELTEEELAALQNRLEELRKRVSKLAYTLRYREVSKNGVIQYERR